MYDNNVAGDDYVTLGPQPQPARSEIYTSINESNIYTVGSQAPPILPPARYGDIKCVYSDASLPVERCLKRCPNRARND